MELNSILNMLDTRTKRDLDTPHRNYVAHNANFDTGLTVFLLLLEQGLLATSKVCDVGCGSLRVGRYLIAHLERDCYHAIEPNQWLLEAAFAEEVGTQPIIKRSRFEYRTDFDIRAAYPDVSRFDFVLISSVLAHASHNQIKAALENAAAIGRVVIFDTVPNGSPDHTEDCWAYPQVASHYDECVMARVPSGSCLSKLHQGLFGEQWWRLDQ